MSLAGIFSYTDKATNWPVKIAIFHESAAAYFAIFVVGNGRGALTPPVFWHKICIIAGPEFGSDAGTPMIVTRALYGLKSSGASWRATFAQTLSDLGYVLSKADLDL